MMNKSGMGRSAGRALVRNLFWAVALSLIFGGCSASSYRRSADKQTYGAIQRVERQVFGHTNAFTIDTPYSTRPPATILPSELIEDRIRTNARALTIEAALELAVQQSREYQDEKEKLYQAGLNLSNTRYAVGDRVTPSSVTTADWNRDSNGDQSSDVTTETGVVISKLFKTGGRLTVDLLNSIMLYYSGKPELSFSKLSGSLVQPLLRGFGRNNVEVEALTQAERNMVYAVRNFGYYQDQFALEVVNEYFRLLQQKDTIRNGYTNYLRRVESTRRLEARSVDREAVYNVDQARQAELTAQNSYVNEVANYLTLLDQFKLTLGVPLSENFNLDDSPLDEVEQTGLVPAPLNADTAYRLATQKQLPTLNHIDQFEDSKRKIRIAADRLKPGLDLFADASLQSEGTDYTRFNADQYQAGVGLQLDLPLDRVPLANMYRNALINFESDLRTFTRRLDDLKRNIDRGVRTLEQRRENYQIQKNALALAERRVASTTMLLEAGRVEVRDVNDALDSLVASQNSVTAALVNYQQARLQLMLDIGALNSEKSKFWLQDHLSSFLPTGTTARAPFKPVEQPVLPPEAYFENQP